MNPDIDHRGMSHIDSSVCYFVGMERKRIQVYCLGKPDVSVMLSDSYREAKMKYKYSNVDQC